MWYLADRDAGILSIFYFLRKDKESEMTLLPL